MKVSKYLPYLGFALGLLMSCVAVGSLHSKTAAKPIKKNEVLKIASRKAPIVKDSKSQASDAYIRNRVIKLYNPEAGQCTGVIVQSESGLNWVLTAAHCSILAKDGRILAELQDGRISQMYVVAESQTADLLLLSPELSLAQPGVKIAKELKMYEKVHSITRGAGMPAYRTDGEALGMRTVMFAISDVATPEDETKCTSAPKYKVMPSMFGKMCVMAMEEQTVTAKIVPGSSGGPLFNAKGELVGIASASDNQEHFFYFVKLSDILEMMKGR